ncbi:MAG: ABC transporter permease [Bacteriovorax sp.]|nr:ABC transporter permease [Bacteriovorax sp.]
MIFLSLKHLTARKKQTILILLGIVLGTTAYVAISGMMLGFQNYILERLVNNEAHIRISAREEIITQKNIEQIFYSKNIHSFWKVPPSGRRDSLSIESPKLWFDKFDKSKEIYAYSPQLTAQVIFKRGDIEITGKVIGSKPLQEIRVSNISTYMEPGQKFTDLGDTGNRIIVGSGLLTRLGGRVSESIILSTGAGRSSPFKIIGTFTLGIAALDNTQAFASLIDIQKLQGVANRISDIGVKLVDVNLAQPLTNSWREFSRDKVESWEEANSATLSVFTIQNITRNFMTISIVVVAAFGIYNILSILVTQKRKEIAILRALGFESIQILEIFLYQGLILGVLGGIIGVILGYGVCLYMSTLSVGSGRMMGSTGKMLVAFDHAIYIKAFAIAFSSALISSIIPAYGATKLTPIGIIRSEGN